MTSYLLAGGGTAGHVNPMLAIADALRERDPKASIVIVGTAEGLEARLVPERGYELVTIDRLPFPRVRGFFRTAPRFVRRWPSTVRRISHLIADRKVDVVIGVGGYAAAPAYSAARKSGVPYVIHEANAKPGIANMWGARHTNYVGVTFEGTPLPHATLVGTPLRREIELLDSVAARPEALRYFALDSKRPVIMVTGGSQGARAINNTIVDALPQLTDAGYQVLHILGTNRPEFVPRAKHYHPIDYCDRMDLALAVSTFVVSRAGSMTVSELSALGIPAAYVPYPVGNGEQRFNARGVVEAGGGLMVDDKDFTVDWVESVLVPVLKDSNLLSKMAKEARREGIRNGTELMVNLINRALSDGEKSGN